MADQSVGSIAQHSPQLFKNRKEILKVILQILTWDLWTILLSCKKLPILKKTVMPYKSERRTFSPTQLEKLKSLPTKIQIQRKVGVSLLVPFFKMGILVQKIGVHAYF